MGALAADHGDLVGGGEVGVHLVQTEGGADGGGRVRTVAGDHHHARDAGGAQGTDGARRLRADAVG